MCKCYLMPSPKSHVWVHSGIQKGFLGVPDDPLVYLWYLSLVDLVPETLGSRAASPEHST
jgi:hypothetical protein